MTERLSLKDRIDHDFKYHEPDEFAIKRHESIRDHAKVFAEFLADNCTESRELSLAITALEESVMWANASIARDRK